MSIFRLAEPEFYVKEEPALKKFLFIASLLWPALSAFACGVSFHNNGNLTNDGTRTFGYNTENQLTNVLVPGQWRSDFIYDGLGRRRIVREYAWSGSWTETNEIHIIYDGYLPLQERDSNNNVRVTYTRGLDLSESLQGAGGIGGLLARTDANGSTFYHSDGAGNITALMDGQEDIVARYMYGPFGKIIGQWGSLAQANEMQFSSMPRDSLSGLSFYPFRAYEPNFQRWLNQDPIQEFGGINLYRGFNNNPWRYVDSFGLQVEGEGEGRADGVTGPSRSEMAEEKNGSLEAQAAIDEQLDASAEALRNKGLDPNGTYLGPQNPPPIKPETPGQFAEDMQKIGDELKRDEHNRRQAEQPPQPEKVPCPNAFRLKLSQTVANHLTDVTKAGNLARPYGDSRLLMQEIMNAQSPVPDPGGVPGGLRWDVPGAMNGTPGTYQFVVDPNSGTALHFTFTK